MKRFGSLGAILLSASMLALQAHADADIYIRDTVTDTGAEPYTGPGPIYLSPDIWVRTEADQNYSPYPFQTNTPSWTPGAHQNPEYRDSKSSRPNYVYVRIHNRGSSATTGTERLRLYQAKAGTGLAWPTQWVDYIANACGEDLLHGIEVTKPRKNWMNASSSERADYVNAVNEIATNATYQYSDGVQYFRKQQFAHIGGNAPHGPPSFLPWHREMMNRYEERLREVDPLVTLLYWDTNDDPVDIVSTGFIGLIGGFFSFGGVNLSRFMNNLSFSADSDSTLLSPTFDLYEDFADRLEARNHDWGHFAKVGGSMGSTGTSAQDPIFFLHHTNVDRLWATWQRDGADPARTDPISAYDGVSSSTSILANMNPWAGGPSLPPWTGTSTTVKTSKHPSVTFAPVYDTAPLNIPVLQPDQSVVMEIPWYPPDVKAFNCSGDAGHFCLLARIETDSGMTFPEGTSVGTNTRENNKIAWKNLTIVDNEVDPLFFVTGTSIHNFLREGQMFDISLFDRTEERRFQLLDFARVALVLPEELLDRVMGSGAELRDLELADMEGFDQPVLQVVGKEPSFQVFLEAEERFAIQFAVRADDDAVADLLAQEQFHFDIEQGIGSPDGSEDPEIGGVRFTIDYAQLLKERERDTEAVFLADFPVTLKNDRLIQQAEITPNAEPPNHLSPGEPVQIIVGVDSQGRDMLRTRVLVDEEELRSFDGAFESFETSPLSFREPGVHRIIIEGESENGEIIRTERRILVSENIPPAVLATSEQRGQTLKVGDTVEVFAQVSPAYERSVQAVTFHLKRGDGFEGGFDLVGSEAYPPLEIVEGEGPYNFLYTLDEPGIYIFQVGAVDDNGVTGASGHVMFMAE